MRCEGWWFPVSPGHDSQFMPTSIRRTVRAAPGGARRYLRDSQEFNRVVNLSDAVFAIAMTLLVLSLEVPRVPGEQLAAALLDQFPQLIAFVLSFALIANLWWLHHEIIGLVDWLEPWMIAINLALLGAVALVPFPTNLVGQNPTARAAVVLFIAVYLLLALLFFGLMLRIRALGAWGGPPPSGLFMWWGDWVVNIVMMVIALIVAFWAPVAGLVVLVLSSTVTGIAHAWLAPSGGAR
jgi:uncharacterized membrane protein